MVTQDTNEPPNKKPRLENKLISQLREELINVRIKAAEQEAQIREEICNEMSEQLTIQEAEHRYEVFAILMLYSLCEKFQVDLETFKVNMKIVFCVKNFMSSKFGN